MFNNLLWKWLSPCLSFADGDAGGGNGGGDKGGDKGNEGMVAKADLDAANVRIEKMGQDLEDMRMEVMTPEYLEFLQAKEGGDKGKADDKGKAPNDTLADDKIEKMSKKELIEHMREERKKEIAAAKDEALSTYKNDNKAKVQGEIKEFASTHDDYETFRPIMYGLSLDPKNKTASLDKLYSLAKDHVKNIHAEPSKEEKERQRKLDGEKPGGDAAGFEPDKIVSDVDATKAAVEDTIEKLGPLPSA